jgi:hypothetical protein
MACGLPGDPQCSPSGLQLALAANWHIADPEDLANQGTFLLNCQASGSSSHLDISGYLWIFLDIIGYERISLEYLWQNWTSFRHIQEKISTDDIQEISMRYPDISKKHIQATYPLSLSMRDIHVYLSNKYPRISIIIQIEYPLQISMKYPSINVIQKISYDIHRYQINIHADILWIS